MNNPATLSSTGVIPGSFFRNLTAEEFSVVPIRGQGSKVYDVQGQEYVDYVLGSGPLLLGHGNPDVVAAVRRQLDKGTQFFFLTPETAALAEAIVAAVPCAEAVRFVTSGTEATYFALRLARAFTGRDKILRFNGAYHGWHDYVLSAFDGPTPPVVGSASAGIPRALEDLVIGAPFNDLPAAEQLIKAHATDLAAVIVEPYQRYLTPRAGFLEGLRDVTRRHGVILVYDEIVTGFRLAYGGAQEYYGVQPDLAALGKVIGGGLPLGAICGRADIMALCEPSRRGRPDWVPQFSTFSGNPLACVAGLAALEQLGRSGVYQRLHALGRRIREGLNSILRGFDVPFQILGEGPTFKVLFVPHPVSNFESSQQADSKLLARFEREWVQRGLYIIPGSRHYISLAHSDEDLDRTLEIAEASARAVL